MEAWQDGARDRNASGEHFGGFELLPGVDIEPTAVGRGPRAVLDVLARPDDR